MSNQQEVQLPEPACSGDFAGCRFRQTESSRMEQLLTEFERPFLIQGHELHIGCSIGISLYPADSANIETLLRHADAALYHAKDCGRNRHAFFNQHLSDDVDERLSLEYSICRALEPIRRLREQGVTVSIDDFGTGYSSLAYLKKLPIDKIKIDRSFVMDIQQATESLRIVEAIVNLGHALSLTVVAEGVETHEQAQLLNEVGTDQGQGFLFARPIPAGQCVEWMEGFLAEAEAGLGV